MDTLIVILSSGLVSAIVSAIFSLYSKKKEIEDNWKIQLRQIDIEKNNKYAEKLEDLGIEYIIELDNLYVNVSSYLDVERLLRDKSKLIKNSEQLQESLSEKVVNINSSKRNLFAIWNRLKFVVPENKNKDCLLDVSEKLLDDAQEVILTFGLYREEENAPKKEIQIKVIEKNTESLQYLSESFIEDMRNILIDLRRP